MIYCCTLRHTFVKHQVPLRIDTAHLRLHRAHEAAAPAVAMRIEADTETESVDIRRE